MSLKVEFVLQTVDDLIAAHGSTLDNETIVHSDQECHYTSLAFIIQALKDAQFVQSMSRNGNCWDNAPQEPFYGHTKDEIADLVHVNKTFKGVKILLEKVISTLNPNEHPIIHSDRGCHYCCTGWINRMDQAELTRSMSKKGYTQDNAACEGMFGRVKNEMFYFVSWTGSTIEEFIQALDKYLH